MKPGSFVEFTKGPNKWRTGTIVASNGSVQLVALHRPNELVLRSPTPLRGAGPGKKKGEVYVVRLDHAKRATLSRPKTTSLREIPEW